MNTVFAATTRREYVRVGSTPALTAMDGGNAENAGAIFGPAGDGRGSKHRIHVPGVNGTAMSQRLH